MKLPTSSSLLIASLAVSLSSSSSLSALAAPTGDLPEGSSPSKPGPVAPCSSDGAPEARSFGTPIDTRLFFFLTQPQGIAYNYHFQTESPLSVVVGILNRAQLEIRPVPIPIPPQLRLQLPPPLQSNHQSNHRQSTHRSSHRSSHRSIQRLSEFCLARSPGPLDVVFEGLVVDCCTLLHATVLSHCHSQSQRD